MELPINLTLIAAPDLVDKWPGNSPDIEVVLHSEQWVEPVGLVVLACLIDAARRRGSTIRVNYAACPTAGYWERMRFFSVLDLEAPPASGPARPAAGRFSELKPVSSIFDVDEITGSLIDVVQPTAEAQRPYSYIVSEALNNICQHSNAIGFCQAQLYKSTSIHFCIGDAGIGLREALRMFQPATDIAAIELALRLGVTSGSSRYGQREFRNRGVGLCAIQRLVTGNGGRLVIWSGSALFDTEGGTWNAAPVWPGTLVVAEMPRNQLLTNFHDVMKQLDDEERKRGR